MMSVQVPGIRRPVRGDHFLLIVLCFFVVVFSSPLSAQTPKETRLSTEPVSLIDMPTAGLLYHCNLSTNLEFLDEGGMVVSAQAGFFNRMMVGIAYGGTNVIGVEKARFFPRLGVLLRARLVEETYYLPAFVLGFSSQGKGPYIDSLNRYTVKSPGLYLVASKNFSALGFLSFHAGTHYSFEDHANRTLNFFGGIEKTFAGIFSGMIEYDNGVRLTKSERHDKGNGTLNLGLRATIGNGFLLGLNLKDLVRNQQQISVGNRTILIEYSRTF